jgi:hypothetical protein
VWVPRYLGVIGEKQEWVEILDLEQKECPVSTVSRHPHMVAMMEEIELANRVKSATGAFPYGMDSTKWPSRWYDGVAMDALEKSRVEYEKAEARKR